jgi:hypothetical protein
MDVDATQAGSFANLCTGDATNVREVLYSLLVGGRSMFSLDIIAQIATFHGCEHPASLDDHTDSRSRLLFHFLSGSCMLHCMPTQQLAYYVAAIKFQYCIYIRPRSRFRYATKFECK